MAVAVPDMGAGAAPLVPGPPASMAARTTDTVPPVSNVRRNARGYLVIALLLSTSPPKGPQPPDVSFATPRRDSCINTQYFVSFCHFGHIGPSAQGAPEVQSWSGGVGDSAGCAGAEEGENEEGLGRRGARSVRRPRFRRDDGRGHSRRLRGLVPHVLPVLRGQGGRALGRGR